MQASRLVFLVFTAFALLSCGPSVGVIRELFDDQEPGRAISSSAGSRQDYAGRERARWADVASSWREARAAVVRVQAFGGFTSWNYETYDESSGSGFVLDDSGTVVTSNHVVTGADFLRVYVKGEERPRAARVLGASECYDLAVIDVEDKVASHLDWHDGPADLYAKVYAAGFPGGDPEYALVRGHVTDPESSGEWSVADRGHAIEHDAILRHGHSGGPCLTRGAG